MHTVELKRAPFSKFKTLRAPMLFGQFLSDVKQIERSIQKYGLMTPIIVTEAQGRLVVADGKKRLAAIRRMTFAGTLPRSLTTVPYIHLEEAGRIDFHTASVLSAYDIYESVMSLKSQGQDVAAIAEALYLCRRSVTDIISLSHLATPLRKAFFNRAISFDQAKAYATLPDEDEQIAILTALGPFAQPQDILTAVRDARFETVINQFSIIEDNVVTLPQTQKTYVWEQKAA